MPSPSDRLAVRRRLAFLLFLQYAFPGAMLPLYRAHLQSLSFGELESAWCCAAQPLATVLTVILVGQVADRYLSPERCLAVCAALAGAALWVLAGLKGLAGVFAATMAFWLLTSPLLLLGTTVCFHHLRRPEREFGSVRLWGTVGWMAPSWLLFVGRFAGLWEPSEGTTTTLFRLGSGFAFALSAYAFYLPPTPPRTERRGLAPVQALRLLRSWPFAVFCVCTLGVCVTQPFTTQGTPLLLNHLGVPDLWLSPALTLSQASEAASMALLPLMMLRLGLRGTMLVGLGAWTTALGVLTVGWPPELVVGSLGFNGLCITGFIVAGQVFVNRQAEGDLRASVQALLTFVNGVGLLVGNLLVGWVRWLNGGEFTRTFAVGALIMAALLLLFLVGFREKAASLPEGAAA
jgi:predicted MFS family arabinose efflux permease